MQVGKDAVVIEADAIKNRDALYQSTACLDMMDQEEELLQHLHEYSTKQAEVLLVAAGAPAPPAANPSCLLCDSFWGGADAMVCCPPQSTSSGTSSSTAP